MFGVRRGLFWWNHLNECEFDEQFKEIVDKAVSDIENGKISEETNTEDEEKCNKYLNYDISIDEVQAVL